VECLSGSGAIASAYNRAFAEVRLPGEIISLVHAPWMTSVCL